MVSLFQPGSEDGPLISRRFRAETASAVLDLAASDTRPATCGSSSAPPQNPPSPFGLPRPVGPSYPTLALQKYLMVHCPSDPEVVS